MFKLEFSVYSAILAIIIAVSFTSNGFAGDLQFTNAPIPTNDLDKRSILTSQFAMVDGEKVDVNYNTILRSGEQPNNSVLPFGTLVDIEGMQVIAEDGSIRVSNDNDFSSLITGDDGNLYMVSHFESRPAAMYLTKLKQKNNGTLVARKTRPLDFSHVNGGWVHCAGSVTPWGNHLGSEEYPPDAKQWRDGNISDYNAAINGATVEFEKMEGITHDPETNTMYLAMSRNINEMSDGMGDISVPYNYCGTVYALDLNKNYKAKNIYGVVSGIPRLFKRGAVEDNPYPEDGPYAANECDLNGISEPDNITFIPEYETLIIGEDTGRHQNDVIWAYNVAMDDD